MSAGTPADVAERHVIGSLLLDPAVLRSVREEIIPADFADLRLGDIYRGIVGMAAKGEPVDYLTVWDHLAEWEVRGIDVGDLTAWSTAVTAPTSAPYYARIVREAALIRDLQNVGRRLLEVREPGVALQDSIEALRKIRDRDMSGGVIRARSLREVLDVAPEVDQYDWAVPGLLERRDRLVLTGSEGGGKSTFLRQIAVLSAAGIHPFRFSPIDPVKVLVVDAENSERQWRRAVRDMAAQAALLGNGDPLENVAIHCLTKQIDITRPQDLGMVHRLVDETRPDLLLIGPLYKLVPRSIKDDDDAAPVIAALDSLRDRNVAMLIEAHAGHTQSSRGERDLRPRGSSALLGWPEFGLGISASKELEHGSRPFHVVRWRGDRDARAWPEKLFRRDRSRPHQTWPWAPAVTL
ncbi:MAG: DnaB domain protein helicase domain protein [Microbacterium sp.]|nr:DnaB domain protein helicase domain protein [Microbacterium sp.]